MDTLYKRESLYCMVAIWWFVLPFTIFRFVNGFTKRRECPAVWWSLACCGFSLAYLTACPIYVGLFDAGAPYATRRACYTQSVALVCARSRCPLYVLLAPDFPAQRSAVNRGDLDHARSA